MNKIKDFFYDLATFLLLMALLPFIMLVGASWGKRFQNDEWKEKE